MNFYRWTQAAEASHRYLSIEFPSGLDRWDFMRGQFIKKLDSPVLARWEDGDLLPDYPFTNQDLPVYSPRLKLLIEQQDIQEIQYLPLSIKADRIGIDHGDYSLANYLVVISCLNMELSTYQRWTKENLLFWEKRAWMLGSLRDLTHPIIDSQRTANQPLFRLAEWEQMIVIREDLKQAIEKAAITGCRFTEIEVS